MQRAHVHLYREWPCHNEVHYLRDLCVEGLARAKQFETSRELLQDFRISLPNHRDHQSTHAILEFNHYLDRWRFVHIFLHRWGRRNKKVVYTNRRLATTSREVPSSLTNKAMLLNIL